MATFRPGKPRWRLRGTENQTLPANTATTLAWSTTIFQEGDLTLGASSVTCDVAGLYIVGGGVLAKATGSNHNLILRLLHNGTPTKGAHKWGSAAAFPTGLQDLLELDVGDVLELVATMGTVGSVVDQNLTLFAGTRIGPVRWT